MAAPIRVGMSVIVTARKWTIFQSLRGKKTFRLCSNDSSATTENEDVSESEESERKLTGFARAFAKHATVQRTDYHEIDAAQTVPEEPKSFATLLRNSSHVHIGNVKGQIVLGKIFHVVDDDLYIDFGGKFHCVCKKPEQDNEKFHHGVTVRLRLRDIELTDHFIGAARDLSLLEADVDLLGLAKSDTK